MTDILKYNFGWSALIFILTFAACSPGRSEPLTGKTVKKDPKVEHGMKVYMISCQKCHPKGESGLGPELNSNPVPGFVKVQVPHGSGVMPAFKRSEISRSDLRDLSKYMKALKHH